VTLSLPALDVALLAPDIPWNAGNLGRTCLAVGARLHLIRPLGFSLEERHVRRAGLDYWRHVEPVVWPDWARFEEGLNDPALGAPYFFSAEGTLELWDVDLRPATMLVFGRESHGLPAEVRERYRSRLVRIPMAAGPVRSLNVSTAAAIALFEALRQRRGPLGGFKTRPYDEDVSPA
jgi:tRNA (cytidine/uridine-2'-O-)-methyltransferase